MVPHFLKTLKDWGFSFPWIPSLCVLASLIMLQAVFHGSYRVQSSAKELYSVTSTSCWACCSVLVCCLHEIIWEIYWDREDTGSVELSVFDCCHEIPFVFLEGSNVLRLWEIRNFTVTVPWMELGILCLFWSCMLVHVMLLHVVSGVNITTPSLFNPVIVTAAYESICCYILWYLTESIGDVFLQWVTFVVLCWLAFSSVEWPCWQWCREVCWFLCCLSGWFSLALLYGGVTVNCGTCLLW